MYSIHVSSFCLVRGVLRAGVVRAEGVGILGREWFLAPDGARAG